MTTREDAQQVLRPYGITITDDTWHRYWTDPLVYSLINIVIGQEQVFREEVAKAMKQGVEIGVDKAMETITKQLAIPVRHCVDPYCDICRERRAHAT